MLHGIPYVMYDVCMYVCMYVVPVLFNIQCCYYIIIYIILVLLATL